MLFRRPLSVPVARVGRSVPESRCAVPMARLLIGGMSLATLALETQAAPPAALPRFGVPQPCAGGSAVCGTSGKALPFLGGYSKLSPGATTAVNAPVWNAGTNTLTVTQNADKVILNWAGFNIDPGNTVKFVQPSSSSAALNKIWDANPSTILGNLQANGTVYLLNQNGIVFGNGLQGSQISVGGLLASTLNLQNGDFLSSVFDPATRGAPLLNALDDNGVAYAPAGILVRQGATLSTPSGANGQLILAGGAVSNQGVLHSPDGQTILAAGDQLWVAPSNSANQTLRGLVVAIDTAPGSTTSGVASNSGTISAEHGNITIAGLTVNQLGVVHATTAVNFNGSVFLTAGGNNGTGPNLTLGKFTDTLPSQLANQFSLGGVPPAAGGKLNIGANSVTEVRPDLSDTTTAVDSQIQQPSLINLQGQTILVGGGASIAAPGGQINLVARSDLSANGPAIPTIDGNGAALNGLGTIVVDSGATIDVSGSTNVPVSVTRNFVQAQLRGNELADSPLQRNGFLYTRNITVDIRGVDSNGNIPLANIAGYVDSIGRTVAERTANGGSVLFNAGSSVVLRQGSTVKLSGGWLDVQGGFASTSKLLGADGKLYDVMTAPNNIRYDGFSGSFSRTSSKWGVSDTWLGLLSSPRSYVAGYLEGRNAGTLQIDATQTALDGTLLATTVRGPNQRTALNTVNPAELGNTVDITAQQYREAPVGGALNLGDNSTLRAQNVQLMHVASPLDPALSDAALVDTGLPASRATTTVLPMDGLVAGGFSQYSLFAQDTITVAAGSPYILEPESKLTLTANTIAFDAGVLSHGGSVSAKAVIPANPVGVSLTALPSIRVADGATLDVSGEWINDSARQASADLGTLKDINGGKISLNAGANLALGHQALLDVSGGAWMSRSGALYAGPAGMLSLNAPASFSSGAQYQGYGFAVGGSLSLTLPAVRIGSAPAQTGETLFDPGFFQQGGFASYTLISQDNLQVDAGARVDALALNRVAVLNAALLPTGAPLSSVAEVALLPVGQRANPVALTLGATLGNSAGNTGVVSIGTGAALSTDPGGSLQLNTNGRIFVDGTLNAPSGSIGLTIKASDAGTAYDATQSIWLGSHAQLLATESSLVATDSKGLRIGGLINDGGNAISLSAGRGAVVTEAGSLIDVSATQTTVDLAQSANGVRVATTLQGNAGTVSFSSGDGLLLAGTLRAHSGGSQGSGGTLKLSLNSGFGNYQLSVTGLLPGALTDQIVLDGAAAPVLPGTALPGNGVAPVAFGTAHLAVGGLAAAGFDSLNVNAATRISLADSAQLSLGRAITLSAPLIDSAGAGANLLQAPVLTLNGSGGAPAADPGPLAVATGAALTLQADQLDLVGHLQITGFDSTVLHSRGDLRLIGAEPGAGSELGSLALDGALTLDAAQIYPSTLSTFRVADAAAITVRNSGGVPTSAPLSAGGALTLSAPVIDQEGVVRAPFGTLALNADQSLTLGAGSITAVSGAGLVVPFGNTVNGQTAYYGFDSNTVRNLSGAPGKRITLGAGTQMRIVSGATLDLSGGGDLLAYESVIGPGGSKDILASANTYAILPGSAYASSYAPFDFSAAGSGGAVHVGSTVYLASGPFAAGWYTLLPSHDALLPGAYAITLMASPNPVSAAPSALADGSFLVRTSAIGALSDATPGVSRVQADGAWLVAGKSGTLDTRLASARWSTWKVLPSATLHSYSQLDTSLASRFFPARAAANQSPVGGLPGDAGTLVLAAQGTLDLASTSTINFSGTTGGRGGELDLSARQLAVVSAVDSGNAALAGYLQIAASTLDAFGAERLVIGGTVDSATGVLTTVASTVEIRNDADHALAAPDLIIAASQQVDVEAGSRLATRTGSGAAPQALTATGDGALLRLTDGALPGFVRSNANSGSANLTIKSNSAAGQRTTLSARGSLTLDGAGAVSLDPDAELSSPALRVDAHTINLGQVPAGTAGADLPTASLVQASELFLQAQEISLYGSTTLASVSAPLSRLTLDAATLNAVNGASAEFDAHHITLQNSSGSDATAAASAGTGSLLLHAVAGSASGDGQLVLGSGAVALSGFSGSTLTADTRLLVQGTISTPTAADGQALQSGASTGTVASGKLATPGTLSVHSPLVLATANSNYTLSTTAALLVDGSSGSGLPADAGAGGRLSLQGSSVTVATTVAAPAGALAVQATGTGPGSDVTLADGGSLLATGVLKTFNGAITAVGGGSVTVASRHGNVQLDSGSQIDVGAASAANAGSVTLNAAEGSLSVAGGLAAKADATHLGGSLAVDASTLAGSGTTLDALLAANAGGGFSESFALRQRMGDLNLASGTQLAAHAVALQVDQGSLNLGGTVSADADSRHRDAGTLRLWAGHNLALQGSLSASSATGAAGTITLGLAASSTGQLSAASGSAIHLDGAAGQASGTLHLVVPRTSGGTDVAIGNFAPGGLLPASSGGPVPIIQLEAVQAYQNVDLVGGNFFGSSGTLATDAATVASNAATLLAHLPTGSNAQLLVGVEIDNPLVQSDGTVLSASVPIDLSGLHFAGTAIAPGTLTLRSGGDLTVAGVITDGFVTSSGGFSQAQLASDGGQWSTRLIAGADLAAADPMTVSHDTSRGSLILAPGALVRTGTGNIDLAAAGDIQFQGIDANTQAAVYTAGVQSPFPSTLAPFADGSYYERPATGTAQQFTAGGGNVTVSAGNDVLGSSGLGVQSVTDWLYRSGTQGVFKNVPEFINPGGANNHQDQTSWWVEFDQFKMNLGALGGGNVTIQAAGNVSDVSAVIPTNGRQGGYISGSPTLSLSNLYVEGGGTLNVRAGGDIAGGSYYVEQGSGSLMAGGGIVASAQSGLGTVLALGNAQFQLQAANNLDLMTAYNPFLTPQNFRNLGGDPGSNRGAYINYFTTYGPDSAVHLLAEGGDVVTGLGLQAWTSALQDNTRVNSGGFGYSVLPGTFSAVAMDGNFALVNAFNLAPAANGNLQVLAGGSIDLRATPAISAVSLVMLDANPANLPNTLHPAAVVNPDEQYVSAEIALLGHGDQALHGSDTNPAVLAADQGSILGTAGGTSGSVLQLPKPVILSAGQDISGLTVVAQNLSATDVTRVDAGRDIVLSPAGQVAPGQPDNTEIEVDGPGLLLLRAGRNIDLGASQGLVTNSNPHTGSPAGAAISLYAGLGACSGGPCLPAQAAFASAYIDPASSTAVNHGNTALLEAYIARLSGSSVDANAAWAAFQALSEAQQAPLIEQVLGNELHLSGLDHNLHGGNFAAGYQAIGTLFPGTIVDARSGKAVDVLHPPTLANGSVAATGTLALAAGLPATGNVNLVYSQVRTLSQGDIGVFTPNGGIDVGLANQPPGAPHKLAGQLGLVTQASGSLRAAALQDINVNASRVFSVGGGDITLWSSFGNIDAGKGAKSVQVVPPPTFTFDSSGKLTVVASGATSGSGIGALLTGPGQLPGNVDLIAPIGVVDAGDAGIRASGNLNIAAATVLNAANIQVGGSSTGVPVTESVTVAAPAPTSSSSSNAAQSSDDTAKRLAADAQRSDALQNAFKPTILTVEVSADEGTTIKRCAAGDPGCRTEDSGRDRNAKH